MALMVTSLQMQELQPIQKNVAILKSTKKRLSTLEAMKISSNSPMKSKQQRQKNASVSSGWKSQSSSLASQDAFQDALSHFSDLQPQFACSISKDVFSDDSNSEGEEGEDSFYTCKDITDIGMDESEFRNQMENFQEITQQNALFLNGKLKNEASSSMNEEDKNRTSIFDIVQQVTQSSQLQVIDEDSLENRSTITSRGFSTRFSTRDCSDFKTSIGQNRGSITNIATTLIRNRATVQVLDKTMSITERFLEESEQNEEYEKNTNDLSNVETFVTKESELKQNQSPQINAFNSPSSEFPLSQLLHSYHKAISPKQVSSRIKKTPYFSFNRIFEIKKHYKCEQNASDKRAEKNFTFNLTVILSKEIQENKFSKKIFQSLLLCSLFLRLFSYVFCIILFPVSREYIISAAIIMLLPRLFCSLSIYSALFSYQRHTLSFRQVTQIFDGAFEGGDVFQIMNMNQLLTSDTFEKLTTDKIWVRLKFIIFLPEFNYLALRKQNVRSLKKKQAWYFSNFILISFEYMIAYIFAFIICLQRIYKPKNYNHSNFSEEFAIVSAFIFGISLIVFLVFSVFYLAKGNIMLRKKLRDKLNK